MQPREPQEVLEIEGVEAAGADWFLATLPYFGISSVTHFVAFLLMFLFMPGLEVGEAPLDKVDFVAVKPNKVPEPPAPPEPPKPPDLSTPAVRDVEDHEKVDMEETKVRNPANEKDMEVSDHYETDDDEDGHGASGDPNQKGVVDTAFQIDSFVQGKGMPTVRGKGQGTGVNERYGQRGPGGRRNLTMAKGGGPRTEDAVKHALEWLKRHQSSDGHWDADGFDANCKGGHCTGTGTGEYDVALTGLSLLAFLGRGETSGSKEYGDVVRRAISWLRGQQTADGCLGPKIYDGDNKHLYNHSIATVALCEAVGLGEYSLKGAAQNAVNYLVLCQNPGKGWRYRNYNVAGTPEEEGGNNDTSVTGWAVMALKAAKVAEIQVPDSAFQGGSAWLDEVMDLDAEYKGTFGYNKPKAWVHKSPYTTTSVGVLVRLLMGQNKGVEEGTSTLLEKLPDWKSANLYYWYYATLALFQKGGEAWAKWNDPMKKALCENQATKGCEDGSWDPNQDTWGGEGGRVYTTAVGALCLEVYYRYKQGEKIHMGNEGH